jgi:tRNA(Ile)-lysidine synthase
MLKTFQQNITDQHLCSRGEKILVAVSGGPDSVVLLDLFDKSGFEISIAHCNFKLRGKESDEDETLVKELAGKYQKAFFVKDFETEKYADEHGLSIQEAARELRYNWFERLADQHGFDRIALGHHRDDAEETFFINLIRGSGLTGLKSIPAKRGRFIRPLLFASRQSVETYAEEHGLKCRQDSSNASDKYLRNRIRHHLIPLLGEIDGRAKEGLAKSLSNLEEDYLILQELINEKRKKMIIRNGEYLTISINDLLTLQPVQTWSYYLLFPFGFNRDTTDSIARSSEEKESGKIFISVSHELLVDREHLFIRDREAKPSSETMLIHLHDEQIDHPVGMEFKVVDNEDSGFGVSGNTTVWFDLDKLHFPLKLRSWKTGDSIRPFGMEGSKLVSDILTDEKVNLFDKEKVMVLESGGVIIWILGIRRSDHFKVGENTRKVYRLRLT